VLEKGYRPQGRAAQAADRQDHRLRRDQAHAETLAELFDAEFADKKPSPDVRFADYVVSGPAPTTPLDGMSQDPRFKKEPFPQILVSVNMLDTGFDCPEVVQSGLRPLHPLQPSSTSRCAAGAPARPARSPSSRCSISSASATTTATKTRWGEAAAWSKSRPRRSTTNPAPAVAGHRRPHRPHHPRMDHGRRERQHAVPRSLRAEGRRTGRPLRGLAAGADRSLNAEQERWLRMLGSQIRANADTSTK
jgi:type I restriction enzyme R subunit